MAVQKKAQTSAIPLCSQANRKCVALITHHRNTATNITMTTTGRIRVNQTSVQLQRKCHDDADVRFLNMAKDVFFHQLTRSHEIIHLGRRPQSNARIDSRSGDSKNTNLLLVGDDVVYELGRNSGSAERRSPICLTIASRDMLIL